jgi:hypothetical protein
VDLEEKLQELAVADFRRIEDDLDRLGVIAVVALSRIRHVAAGIADPRRYDAGHAPDQILHAPETTPGQNRAFV